MKIKTSELTGAALDWAVASAEGGFDLCLKSTYGTKTAWMFSLRDDHDVARIDQYYLADYSPSADWALGGLIIDREKISVIHMEGTQHWVARKFQPACDTTPKSEGPTPLMAAMRCFVASRLGEEVDVPEELA